MSESNNEEILDLSELDKEDPQDQLDQNDVLHLSPFELVDFFNFHVSIIGKSGSGKTVLANTAFEQIPNTAIFFNTMGLRGIKGKEVRSLKEFDRCLYEDTFNNKTHKLIISIKLHEDIEDYTVRVLQLVKRIRKLQDRKYVNNIKRRVTLFFDEIQYLCEDKEFLKKVKNISLLGRNKNLFACYISQRGQNVPKDMLTQSNCFIGHLENFDVAYFHRIKMFIPYIKEDSYQFFWYNKEKMIKLQV